MIKKTGKKRLIIVVALLFSGIILANWAVAKHYIQNPLQLHSYKNKNIPLSDLLSKETIISILIDKSDYQLHVYTADTLVKSYPVVLGGNPVDDKLMEGDRCTPEGNFTMRSKYPHKSWSKFIWINYPTTDSWRKHKKAKAEGRIPKNARIGGEIGIHGVPKGADYIIKTGVNWTLGCISLSNKDINEIYPFVDKETLIKIQK